MSVEHKLKTLSPYWDAVERGDKTFEVRRDDRGFQKGDVLVLMKFDGRHYVMDGYGISANPFTIRVEITYVLTGGQFGIEPGYVVIGFRRLP